MIQMSKLFLSAVFTVTVTCLALGCGAPDSSADLRAASPALHIESVVRSSAADTAVWTNTYIGEAFAGRHLRQPNIKAKVALVMKGTPNNLYLVLYFCGKDDTLIANTKWLTGHVPGDYSKGVNGLGAVDLAEPDGSKAHISMSGPGTFTSAHGDTYNWVAYRVTDSSGGLYRYVFPGGVDTNNDDLTGAVVGYIEWNGGFQGAVSFAHDPAHVEVVIPLVAQLADAGVEAGVGLGVRVTFKTDPAPVGVLPVDPIALAN